MTRRARNVTLLVLTPLLVVLTLLAMSLRVPYVVMSPGPVINALGEVDGKPVVTVTGARTYPTDGSLNVTTVYELGGPGSHVSLLQVFRGWLDSADTVLPYSLLYPPDVNANEEQQQGVQQMQTSQQTAVAAALREVGKPVRTVVAVGQVDPGTPADGKLQPGDEVIAVDGQRVQTPEQVRRLIGERKPGDQVRLEVRRDGKRLTIRVVTEAAPDDPTRPIVGFVPTVIYKSPVDVTISLGDVGGPSAGLMFATTIVDKLTPGALTDGHTVAGTGTIDSRGRVGAIGGIAQKMAGARQQGAELFLAPKANCTDVVGHVPDGLTVVPVSSLTGALDVIHAFTGGQRSFPQCTVG